MDCGTLSGPGIAEPASPVSGVSAYPEQWLGEIPEVRFPHRRRVARSSGIGHRFVRDGDPVGGAHQKAVGIDELCFERVVGRQQCEDAVVRVHAMHAQVVPTDHGPILPHGDSGAEHRQADEYEHSACHRAAIDQRWVASLSPPKSIAHLLHDLRRA
jgi:hypothetical protein